jgi:sec-independent protein translocase protein TatB
MFGIGLGELFVIGVVALLVIGPERLPAAAAQFARTLRSVQEQATRARRDLDDALGPELTELRQTVHGLDPRRALRSEVTAVRNAIDDSAGAAGNAGSTVPEARNDAAPRPRVDPDAI